MAQPLGSELVERLAAIPYTGAISDILDEMGFTGQGLPHQIQAVDRGQTLAGRALTILGETTTSTDPEIIFVPFLRMLGTSGPATFWFHNPTTMWPRTWGSFPAKLRSTAAPVAR
jgi:hypothetical protein